tara:strand:+ start:1385 stop:2227 length:843 start_codon:yes stop_codon:yes gene_type:complete
MDDLEYSNDALNTMGLFYSANNMLYVEGEDDVVFWQLILGKFGIHNLEVQELGGKEEITKMLNRIVNEDLNVLIASDLDFWCLQERYNTHERVIRTYGHSIENTLICEEVICKVIKSHGRLRNDHENRRLCSNWLHEFYESFKDLIIYDAMNEISSTGINVLGSNCTRFMTSQLSPQPSPEKIINHLHEIKIQADFEPQKEIFREKVGINERKISDFMRGHFLFSAALKYANHKIKSAGSNKNISINSFFSSSILAFETIFNDHHPHFQHYETELQRLDI